MIKVLCYTYTVLLLYHKEEPERCQSPMPTENQLVLGSGGLIR